MSSTAIFINAFAGGLLIIAFTRDRARTTQALKVAGKAFIQIIPVILIIIVLIGLLLGFVPPSEISRFVGEQSGVGGILLVALVGAILHIPALVAFPLGASLRDSGASITAVAAFITTLTMIGTVTLPLEIKELGKKMALLRNGISFIIAITIAVIIGVVL